MNSSTLRIGYACLNQDISPNNYRICRKGRLTQDNLREVIAHNLLVLELSIDYNIKNKNRMFRISSSLIPFGSSELNTADWESEFKDDFDRIRTKIIDNDIRVSVHPGQYTVINSPNSRVVNSSIEELRYHVRILELLARDTTSKMILHVGGVYDDKKEAKKRFEHVYTNVLNEDIKKYLVIENDDRLYTVEDVLEISSNTGVPVVFDNLHHEVNPSLENVEVKDMMQKIISTWSSSDGRPKAHYSQQAIGKRLGAHSDTIYLDRFESDYHKYFKNLEVDIMLEVKDKNRSFIKVNQLFNPTQTVLENEWARYKYWVMARSQNAYNSLRKMFKDNKDINVKEFYRTIDMLRGDNTSSQGSQINAFQHIWGYFKDISSNAEKEKYLRLVDGYKQNDSKHREIYRFLDKLANKYNVKYLRDSYFFEGEK